MEELSNQLIVLHERNPFVRIEAIGTSSPEAPDDTTKNGTKCLRQRNSIGTKDRCLICWVHYSSLDNDKISSHFNNQIDSILETLAKLILDIDLERARKWSRTLGSLDDNQARKKVPLCQICFGTVHHLWSLGCQLDLVKEQINGIVQRVKSAVWLSSQQFQKCGELEPKSTNSSSSGSRESTRSTRNAVDLLDPGKLAKKQIQEKVTTKFREAVTRVYPRDRNRAGNSVNLDNSENSDLFDPEFDSPVEPEHTSIKSATSQIPPQDLQAQPLPNVPKKRGRPVGWRKSSAATLKQMHVKNVKLKFHRGKNVQVKTNHTDKIKIKLKNPTHTLSAGNQPVKRGPGRPPRKSGSCSTPNEPKPKQNIATAGPGKVKRRVGRPPKSKCLGSNVDKDTKSKSDPDAETDCEMEMETNPCGTETESGDDTLNPIVVKIENCVDGDDPDDGDNFDPFENFGHFDDDDNDNDGGSGNGCDDDDTAPGAEYESAEPSENGITIHNLNKDFPNRPIPMLALPSFDNDDEETEDTAGVTTSAPIPAETDTDLTPATNYSEAQPNSISDLDIFPTKRPRKSAEIAKKSLTRTLTLLNQYKNRKKIKLHVTREHKSDSEDSVSCAEADDDYLQSEDEGSEPDSDYCSPAEDTDETSTSKRRGRPKGSKNRKYPNPKLPKVKKPLGRPPKPKVSKVKKRPGRRPMPKIHKPLKVPLPNPPLPSEITDLDNLEPSLSKQQLRDIEYNSRTEFKWMGIQVTKENEKWKCWECNNFFKTQGGARSHIKQNHVKKEWKCAHCLEIFDFRPDLVKHTSLAHTGERLYNCQWCAKSYLNRGSLHWHTKYVHKRITKHGPPKLHPCSICKKTFPNKGKLAGHMRWHTGERPFLCEICSHGVATTQGLVLHMRTYHSGSEATDSNSKSEEPQEPLPPKLKRRQCNICKKIISKASMLKSHMRRHTGERPFECDICGHRTANQHSMHIHKRCKHEYMLVGGVLTKGSLLTGATAGLSSELTLNEGPNPKEVQETSATEENSEETTQLVSEPTCPLMSIRN